MMNASRFEQARISQLLGSYAPADRLVSALDFGDYLSLLWRLDRCADKPRRAGYYRLCLNALAKALDIQSLPIHRLVEAAVPGDLYRQLPNLPYRAGTRQLDAADRKAAIIQIIHLRDSILEIGAYQQQWGVSYPGAGIQDVELRERVFAVLFTALQGQFGSFARLLLVADIVLGNLLLGYDSTAEVEFDALVLDYAWPDPAARHTQREYDGDDPTPARYTPG